MRNERGVIITDLGEVKRIIKGYYEQSYDTELDKQDEMDNS